MHVWDGFGPDRALERAGLAGQMESLYRIPFERLERYCPYVSPEETGASIQPHLEVGCARPQTVRYGSARCCAARPELRGRANGR